MTDISAQFPTKGEDIAEALKLLDQHLIDIGFPAGAKVLVTGGGHRLGETGIVYGPGPHSRSVAVQNPKWGRQQPGTDWEFFNIDDLDLVQGVEL